jgi:hypothetical protein
MPKKKTLSANFYEELPEQSPQSQFFLEELPDHSPQSQILMTMTSRVRVRSAHFPSIVCAHHRG